MTMDKEIDSSRLRRRFLRRLAGWLAALGAVAAVAVTVVALSGRSIDRRDIIIGTVDQGPLDITVAASGHLVPAYEEMITSPVSSRVLRIFAQVGDSVIAGEPLLEIDLREEQTACDKLSDRSTMQRKELTQLQINNRTIISDLEMQIEVSEMELSRLRTEVQHEIRLDSIGSGTGDRVRQAQSAFRKAELQLRQLRRKLDNERLCSSAAEEVQQLNVSTADKDLELARRTLRRGRIPAPIHGVVTFINSDLGSQVSAGEKVAVVADLSRLHIIGQVPEASSSKVSPGAGVNVRIGSGQLTGVVTNVSPQAKQGVVDFVVRLDDPASPLLRSGRRAELYVAYGYKDNVVRIPAGSYFQGAGDYNLFVLDSDTRLVRRSVRLGDSNRNYAEVISGLIPGDRVVVSDMTQYKNNQSLKIK